MDCLHHNQDPVLPSRAALDQLALRGLTEAGHAGAHRARCLLYGVPLPSGPLGVLACQFSTSGTVVRSPVRMILSLCRMVVTQRRGSTKTGSRGLGQRVNGFALFVT